MDGVKTYDDLLDAIETSGKTFDMDMIRRAYDLAYEKHKDQVRRSGDPYISHPVATAIILVELGMDSECITAGLLHDVVEDTEVSLKDVTRMFGPSIAHLIDGVTKMGKIPYTTKEEEQAENIRKMLIAMSDDIRVIIIKLADRLHNMRTLQYMDPQKQRDKALESMEVFAPIAHRLGIKAVKDELEDISLRYLDPVAYKEIEDNLALQKEEREKFIHEMEEVIIEKIKPIVPKVFVNGRVKSIHGIYRKVYIDGRSLDEIFDIFALRVIVDTVQECYNVFGIIHDMFQPIPSRFKDFISTPKPNLYQSLHTTVISDRGIPFEVQIRTWEMHHRDEYGIAAHWKYKLNITKTKDTSYEDAIAWIRHMIEENDPTDIVKTIKNDLSKETVFVFTPTGEVKNLPVGSTVIDFAYSIHSEVGNRMIGAKVNKRIVPITYEVQNGDIIEIITSKESTNGPSRDWLSIVKTSEAKNKIRQWFKREQRKENILAGRNMLDKELRHSGASFTDQELSEILASTMKKKSCNTIEDLFCALGYGGVSINSIMPKIRDEIIRRKQNNPTNLSEPHQKVKHASFKSNSIVVEGMTDCLTKLSKCCSPLPGDNIIGYITRGFGVSIHKRNCTNVPQIIELSEEPDRWVKAFWVDNLNADFDVTLEIIGDSTASLMMNIVQQLFNMHVPNTGINSRVTRNGNTICELKIVVGGLDHLASIIHRLAKIQGVSSVRRL